MAGKKTVKPGGSLSLGAIASQKLEAKRKKALIAKAFFKFDVNKAKTQGNPTIVQPSLMKKRRRDRATSNKPIRT